MTFDKAILQRLVIRVDVTDYVRIVPRAHAATPLGMGYGKTRFSSPKNKFKLLYLAEDSKTSLAETLIRDRYQGETERLLMEDELEAWSIASMANPSPLNLIDAILGRAHSAGRAFSQKLYDQTSLDGIA